MSRVCLPEYDNMLHVSAATTSEATSLSVVAGASTCNTTSRHGRTQFAAQECWRA